MLMQGSDIVTGDKAMYPTVHYSPRLLRCATRELLRDYDQLLEYGGALVEHEAEYMAMDNSDL